MIDHLFLSNLKPSQPILMSDSNTKKTPYKTIEKEKKAYLEELSGPDSDCPPDVRAILKEIQDNLFEFDLQVQNVLERCGCRDNSVYTRFRFYIGHSPKDYILLHRVCLSKRLLKHNHLTVGDVAMGVGYGNPSSFSQTFKKRVGVPPGRYREN